MRFLLFFVVTMGQNEVIEVLRQMGVTADPDTAVCRRDILEFTGWSNLQSHTMAQMVKYRELSIIMKNREIPLGENRSQIKPVMHYYFSYNFSKNK